MTERLALTIHVYPDVMEMLIDLIGGLYGFDAESVAEQLILDRLKTEDIQRYLKEEIAR